MSLIIDQDMERVYQIRIGESLHIHTVIFEKVLIGFNLILGNHFLGTFDTYGEAENEMGAIICSKEEVHLVSGFSDWGNDDEMVG